MRKKLLITTALVALVSASNAWAQTIIDSSKNNWTDEDGDSGYSINETAGSLLDNDNVVINNTTVWTQDNYERKDGQKLEINQGLLSVNGTGKGDFTPSFKISGGDIIVNGFADSTQSSGIYGTGIEISGGNIVLNNAGLTDDGTDHTLSDGRFYPAASIDVTGGTVEMNTSDNGKSWFDSHGHIDYDDNGEEIEESRKGGEINLSGTGKIIVNGGVAKITEDFQGMNIWAAKDINIKDGGTLEITSGSNLVTMLTSKNQQKSTINLTDTGTINLSGGLLANVEGNGNLNVKSSSALVDGNISGSNLTFEADHSLSKAVSGTIGDLASLNVNKGTLTYDAPTGKIGNLNVAGGLDIGTNTVNATNVDFKDNSTLKFTVAGKEDGSYGKIKADTINVSTTGTKLDLTLNSSVLGKDEAKEFTILDGTVTNDFAELSQNSRYKFEKVGNGVYKITGTATATDTVVEAGGTANNAGTATAWDSVSLDNPSGSVQGRVANVLADLAGKTNTTAGQKAYVDALTAVAPEVAPMVQKTQTETANQVFGAVSTRLTGGSISTGSEGMSSGDSNPDAAVWVQGMYNHSKLDDTSKAKGFDSDSAGVALGIEKFINKDVKVGAGYAYTNTDIDGFMRDTDVDTHTAILYGEYKPSNWYINGIATYGWRRRAESELFFYQIISFKVIFNLVTLMA